MIEIVVSFVVIVTMLLYLVFSVCIISDENKRKMKAQKWIDELNNKGK
jgi:preprotein translocase subunit YajC